MQENSKIAIFTPLRDEAHSIDKLFSSLECQSEPIDTWVIIENGSSDGSGQKLAERAKKSSIRNVIVLNIGSPSDPYALGTKVSQVIQHGMSYARSLPDYEHFTHIGVLDADCFPEPDYYCKLVNFLEKNPKVGITSGLIFIGDGTLDEASANWVRGGCRLWRMNCFRDAGYIVGPSWDALCSAKAAVSGWSSVVCPDATVISREVGARSSQAYYGMASYYRGVTPLYAALRGCYLSLRSPKKGVQYLQGYFSCLLKKAPRVNDEEILKYFESQGLMTAIKALLSRLGR